MQNRNTDSIFFSMVDLADVVSITLASRSSKKIRVQLISKKSIAEGQFLST